MAYDATGQQVSSFFSGGWSLSHSYDGDRLRVRRDEGGQATYYVRSSVLGGQVVAEVNAAGAWLRGHVYAGGQALAVQEENAVWWVHEDPVTKTKKRTDSSGAVTSTTLVDPWGGEAAGAWALNPERQGRKFTTYERDASGRDEAQQRSYSAWHSRFDQPDPSDSSYDLSDPQSLNRYAYTQNDPVNFVDPSGLNMAVVTCQAYGWFPTDGRGNPTGPQIGGDIVVCVIRGGGGGRRGGGGLGAGNGAPQNTAGIHNQGHQLGLATACDEHLAKIFGGNEAVAAGSGFEPPNMPGRENQFRGGSGGHLNNAMHLYGSGDGYGEGGVYIPAGGRYIGRNPYSNEDSYMFFYSRFGNARNVTLFTSHVDNFRAPGGTTTGRTRIGDIGGDGGRSPYNPNDPFNKGPYIHAHLAIHRGRGYTGNRLSFSDVFCK